MKNVIFAVAAIAVVGCFAAAPQQAEARPDYLKGFVKKYDIAEASEKKCATCHGKSKKMLSDYAKTLGKALGKKKVKDQDVISKALAEAEKGDAGDGKTYGDILKAKKLPAPYSE